MEIMLEVKNLCVEVDGKEILKDINLTIKKGEVMVLFGPNGSGKSTLIKAIMGFSGYRVTGGEIFFKGRRIDGLAIEERAKLGIGMMHQHSPRIRGVKLKQMAHFLSEDEKAIAGIADRLSLKEHLDRDINLGFSGGEMKRAELFQLVLQDPDLLLLDEPESGVDLENIALMGDVLNRRLNEKGKSALVITHSGYILDYLKAKAGCMMVKGKFWCMGSPKEMFKSIREGGYEKCRECYDRKGPE